MKICLDKEVIESAKMHNTKAVAHTGFSYGVGTVSSPGRMFPNSVTRVVPGLSGRSCQPIRDETPSVTSLLAQQNGARQAIAAVGVMMRWLTT